MPSLFKLTRLMQILLIAGVMIIFMNIQKQTGSPRGSYDAVVLISVLTLLSNYDLFQRCTRFAPHIFINHFYRRIESRLNEGRQYYGINGINQRIRRKTLPKIVRAVRYCMRMTGWPTICLVLLFGQEIDTINRDCKFIARIVIDEMYTEEVHLALPGTQEYTQWVGGGVLAEHFRSTIYIVDICKFIIGKPGRNQMDFFDGHNHDHNVGVGVICNGWGKPCAVSKPYPGTVPDGVIWAHMKRVYKLNSYILPNNYIVGDRIFRFEDWPMITAYTGYEEYTGYMLLFNYFLAVIRIIIENLFCRFKVYFPIFMRWTLPVEDFDLYLHAGMVMLSIILKYQSPLRRQ